MNTLILTGVTAPLNGGVSSAINKQPITSLRECTTDGLAGDEQADHRHHGGIDRALHYYPQEHFAYWKTFWKAMRLPSSPTPFKPGAFGENLSDTGMTEEQVHIGDIFTLGEAVIQISQPRSPCFKLNIRFGYPQMSLILQTSGKTGWLFRILKPGIVQPGDQLTKQEEDEARITVKACLDTLYNQPFSAERLTLLVEHPALSKGWRRHASNWIDNTLADDWSRRLFNQTDSSAG
jgi:MOSC domain-containing protein YiiM